jgi:hypothetical protein
VCWQATRGTAAQWKHVEADWAALAAKAGVRHIHAVDLFRRTKQFRGWKPEDVNALALSLDGVIARYLQLGFSVIVRDDDYKNIYGAEPHPRRPVKDTKYGVCFRAWLAFVPSFIASELKLAGQGALAEPTRIDFALEGGACRRSIRACSARQPSAAAPSPRRQPHAPPWRSPGTASQDLIIST